MYKLKRGEDWTIDFRTCTWDDGTAITEGELATATLSAIVAGVTAVVTPDPVSGVRLRLEVDREVTADVAPRQYRSGVNITISGKLSTYTFDVLVEAGFPTPRVPCA